MTDENLLTESEETGKLESVEDTVARAFAEASTEIDEEANEVIQGGESEKSAEPEVDASKAASILARSKKGKARKVVEAAELEPVKPAEEVAAPIEAPHAWNIQEKQWFARQPKEAQQAILRRESERDAHFTRKTQELAAEKARYSEVNSLLDHYVPRWGLNGITPAQAASELFAMQDLLATDPLQGLTKIMRINNIDVSQLAQYQQSGGQVAQAPQQPQQAPLTMDQILATLEARQRQQAEQAYVSQAQSEVEQMALEMGQNGQPLWPELANPMQVERVKPLVKDLVERTQPGISIVEATKRAIFTLRALDGTQNGSAAPITSPRLPTQQNELARARAASVSVRGRGVAAVPNNYQPKPNERVEDTIRNTLAMFNS